MEPGDTFSLPCEVVYTEPYQILFKPRDGRYVPVRCGSYSVFSKQYLSKSSEMFVALPLHHKATAVTRIYCSNKIMQTAWKSKIDTGTRPVKADTWHLSARLWCEELMRICMHCSLPNHCLWCWLHGWRCRVVCLASMSQKRRWAVNWMIQLLIRSSWLNASPTRAKSHLSALWYYYSLSLPFRVYFLAQCIYSLIMLCASECWMVNKADVEQIDALD